MMGKKTGVLYLLLLFLMLSLSISCMMPFAEQENGGGEEPGEEERNGFNSNLPLVIIDTFGEEIADEPKIPANMKIIHNPGDRNYICDAAEFDGRIGIEIRGRSSQRFPKKSYGFETWDEDDNDTNVSLLGFPEESDWILYGPYSDKSLLRNHLAYTLTNQAGHWASRTRFVEVLFKEEDDCSYQGVYVFMEKIKRGEYRVDIEKMEPAHNAEPEITGGYILKIDKDEDTPYFVTLHNIRIFYEYPKKEQITRSQQAWIEDYVNDFETALISDDFDSPQKGYARYIDVESFIDYMLLREFFRDVDTYVFSTFMHKDRQGKLKMGPVWDFNLAMGNCNYGYQGKTDGWELGRKAARRTFWWRSLLKDGSFMDRAVRRWQELRSGVLSIDNIFSIIDDAVLLLDEAQGRNFEQWPILGEYVWPNPEPYPQTFMEEIARLKRWLEERARWMDDNIHTLRDAAASHDGLCPN